MRDLIPPPEVVAYDQANGALHYTFFADAEGSTAALEGAVLWHVALVLKHEYGFARINPERLSSLPRKVIDRRTFFGEWYDMDRDALIRLGTTKLRDGTILVDPTFDEIAGTDQLEFNGVCPRVGSGGNYAYAFTETPYHLSLSYRELQDIFRAINGYILPDAGGEVITDFSSTELAEFAEHFESGMDYWGVFLFTIFDPVTRRLAVISASTSD